MNARRHNHCNRRRWERQAEERARREYQASRGNVKAIVPIAENRARLGWSVPVPVAQVDEE